MLLFICFVFCLQLISYAEEAGIPVPSSKRGEPPFSMDANLLHISYEGNALEDPWQEPDESMFTRSVSPEDVRHTTDTRGGDQANCRHWPYTLQRAARTEACSCSRHAVLW